MMDTIFIQQLEIETIIGVYHLERNVKQTIILDIEMQYDCRQAIASDNLKYALDYHKLSKNIQSFVSQSSYYLIETLADAVADYILQNNLIRRLKLTLSKPNALDNNTNVGIIICRANDV